MKTLQKLLLAGLCLAHWPTFVGSMLYAQALPPKTVFRLDVSTSRIKHNTALFIRTTIDNESEVNAIVPAPLGCYYRTLVYQLKPENGEWFSIRAVEQDGYEGFGGPKVQEIAPHSSYCFVERIAISLRNPLWKSGKYALRAMIVYPDAPEKPEAISEECTLEIEVDEKERGVKSTDTWKRLSTMLSHSSLAPIEEKLLAQYREDPTLPKTERQLLSWLGKLSQARKRSEPKERQAIYSACEEQLEQFPEFAQMFLRYKLGVQAIDRGDTTTCCVQMGYLPQSSREWKSLKHRLADAGYRFEKGVAIPDNVPALEP